LHKIIDQRTMPAVLPSFERHRSRVMRLAWGAIAAQALFVGGWLVYGAIEGHGYSFGRHDISDLGALTAHHVWLNLPTLGISGALTVLFAIFALRPALMQADLKQPVSAWLVALSLPALDPRMARSRTPRRRAGLRRSRQYS
jgi:hypothetical protein